jgi:hypothetical protein
MEREGQGLTQTGEGREVEVRRGGKEMKFPVRKFLLYHLATLLIQYLRLMSI